MTSQHLFWLCLYLFTYSPLLFMKIKAKKEEKVQFIMDALQKNLAEMNGKQYYF